MASIIPHFVYQVSKFLYWQSPKVSDFLIPTDFEANLLRSPVVRGQWLLKNVFLMRLFTFKR